MLLSLTMAAPPAPAWLANHGAYGGVKYETDSLWAVTLEATMPETPPSAGPRAPTFAAMSVTSY